MTRKKIKRKIKTTAQQIPTFNKSLKRHILTLYGLIIFIWVMVLSMFLEKTGSFILNIRAMMIGGIFGIITAWIIYQTDLKY